MGTVLTIAATLATLGAAWAVITKVWPAIRALFGFIDEVTGEPARFGRPAQPSLIQKVDQLMNEQTYIRGDLDQLGTHVSEIRHEVFPNSGGSMRDRVDDTAAGVIGLADRLDRLEERAREHHPEDEDQP